MLPLIKPPLLREHRLYQADWLLRFYGFDLDEVASSTQDGMLDLAVDPKLAWALANRHEFPLDVNSAPRDRLLRVPGLGVRSVNRIIAARRSSVLRYGDVQRLGAVMSKAKAFLKLPDWTPASLLDRTDLRDRLVKPTQLELFS